MVHHRSHSSIFRPTPILPSMLLSLVASVLMGASTIQALGLDMSRLFEPQPLPTLEQLMNGGNANPYQWQSAQPYGQVGALGATSLT